MEILDELPDQERVEALDFIGHLRWRREEKDQSWFWTQEWQARYREAKQDLAQGRFRDSDDIEALLAELKGVGSLPESKAVARR